MLCVLSVLSAQLGELAQRVSKVEAALLGLTTVKEALEAQRAALEFGRQLEKLEQARACSVLAQPGHLSSAAGDSRREAAPRPERAW